MLRRLEPESVQCAVTSPPYWSLRRYAGEQEVVWPPLDGGDHGCDHVWAAPGGERRDAFCSRCGAWRGAFELEPTAVGRDTRGGAGKVEPDRWPPEALEGWPTRPAIVLDPFAGTGTTLMVAEELGRWWIGIELAEEYVPLIRERTSQVSLTRALHPCPSD